MLERASRCLEPRIWCSRATQKRARHELRLLHSSFWDHGANRFDLPPFALPHETVNVLGQSLKSDSAESHASPQGEGPLLDFLYPPQALALLARPLPRSVEASATKRRIQGRRKFSSFPWVEKKEDVRLSRLRPSPSQSPLDVFSKTAGVRRQKQDSKNNARNFGLSTQPQTRNNSNVVRPQASTDVGNILDAYGVENHPGATVQPARQKSKNIPNMEPSSLPPSGRIPRPLGGFSKRPRERLPLTGDSEQDAVVHRERLLEHIHDDRTGPALDLMNDAIYRGVKHDFGAGILLKHLVSRQLWADAASLLWSLQRFSVKAKTPDLLNSALDEVCTSTWLDLQVDGLLDAIYKSEVRLSSGFVNLLLHLANGQIDALLRLNSNLEFKPRAGKLIELIKSMQRKGQGTGSIFEAMLVKLLQARKVFDRRLYTDLAGAIWTTYRSQADFRPSTSLLVNIINAWKDSKLIIPPTKLKDKTTSLTPESIEEAWVRTYRRLSYVPRLGLMIIYANIGRADKVETLVADYVQGAKAEPLDPNIFWPLIQVHAVRRDASAAQKEFDNLVHEYKIQPTARTWDLLLRAYERSDDLEGALTCFQKRLDSGVELTPQCFTQVMTLYGQLGNADAIMDIMRIAEQSSVAVDTRMINTLIVAHSNAGDYSSALEVFDETLQQHKMGRIQGSLTFCFNSVLVMHALRRDHDATIQMYQRMKADGVPVDENTFAAVILAHTLRRRPGDAWGVLHKAMPEHGLAPNEMHYIAVIGGFILLDDHKQALKVYRDMRAKGLVASIAARAAYAKATRQQDLAMSKRPKTSSDSIDHTPQQQIIDDLVNAMEAGLAFGPGKKIDSTQTGLHMQGMISNPFTTIVRLHGPKDCVRAAQRLFETDKSRRVQQGHGDLVTSAPFRLTVALMSVFSRTANKQQMQECWDLLVKQSAGILNVPKPALEYQVQDALSEFEDTEPTVAKKSKKAKKMAAVPQEMIDMGKERPGNARGLRMELSLPFRIWALTMLEAPGASSSDVTRVLNVATSLLRSGFELENATLNALVVRLCQLQPPRTLLAFILVEKFLITEEFAWERPLMLVPSLRKPLSPHPNQARVAADTRHIVWPKRIVAPTDRLPLYTTMVHLAYALIRLRHREAGTTSARAQLEAEALADASRGLNEVTERQGQVGTKVDVRLRCPLTLRAVRKLPITYDALQSRLLHKGPNDFVLQRKGRYGYRELGLGGAEPINRTRIKEKRLLRAARREVHQKQEKSKHAALKNHAEFWAKGRETMESSDMVSLLDKGFIPRLVGKFAKAVHAQKRREAIWSPKEGPVKDSRAAQETADLGNQAQKDSTIDPSAGSDSEQRGEGTPLRMQVSSGGKKRSEGGEAKWTRKQRSSDGKKLAKGKGSRRTRKPMAKKEQAVAPESEEASQDAK